MKEQIRATIVVELRQEWAQPLQKERESSGLIGATMTETAREKMQKTLEHWRKGREEEKKIGTPLPKRFWDIRKKRSPRYKRPPETAYSPKAQQVIARNRGLIDICWLTEMLKTPEGQQKLAENLGLTETDWSWELEQQIKWECVLPYEEPKKKS